jgi:L-rhamnose isomerase
LNNPHWRCWVFEVKTLEKFQQMPANDACFESAKQRYASLGVDVEYALEKLESTPVSIHCWQGDDVRGFENSSEELGGGLAVTGNYPGRARNIQELRQDLEQVLKLLPGKHRLNLHAIYGDFSKGKVERNQLTVAQFESWIKWCREKGLGMDFNPSCFSHPLAADGFTLSHKDEKIRRFWIEHCQVCRRIGAETGRRLGSACVTNIWIPDGMKDTPADRLGYRKRLEQSLDEIFAERLDEKENIDAVESKLFGIGSESYVVGSHDFYLGYAVKNKIALCLDAGHFHPTENLSDKISSVLLHVPRILLHVSRGIRWDSDHVVVLDDTTTEIMREVVRCDALNRVHMGLDYFDASINRIAAWTLGVRAARKALLKALLEPSQKLRELESDGDYTGRLILQEATKSLPWNCVWAEYLTRSDKPDDLQLMTEISSYERAVLSKRN